MTSTSGAANKAHIFVQKALEQAGILLSEDEEQIHQVELIVTGMSRPQLWARLLRLFPSVPLPPKVPDKLTKASLHGMLATARALDAARFESSFIGDQSDTEGERSSDEEVVPDPPPAPLAQADPPPPPLPPTSGITLPAPQGHANMQQHVSMDDFKTVILQVQAAAAADRKMFATQLLELKKAVSREVTPKVDPKAKETAMLKAVRKAATTEEMMESLELLDETDPDDEASCESSIKKKTTVLNKRVGDTEVSHWYAPLAVKMAKREFLNLWGDTIRDYRIDRDRVTSDRDVAELELLRQVMTSYVEIFPGLTKHTLRRKLLIQFQLVMEHTFLLLMKLVSRNVTKTCDLWMTELKDSKRRLQNKRIDYIAYKAIMGKILLESKEEKRQHQDEKNRGRGRGRGGRGPPKPVDDPTTTPLSLAKRT